MGAILSYLFLHPSEKQITELVTQYELPLPAVLHKVLTDKDIKGRDILIIGDVHGCLEELKELLTVTGVLKNSENTVIIFAGDVINKGPYSYETIRFIQNLPHAYIVRGNHEEMVVNRWRTFKRTGIKDPRPKCQWLYDLPQDVIEYLLELPYTISVPSANFVVVHGGFNPYISIERQRPIDMTLTRNVIDSEDITKFPTTSRKLTVGLPWASIWMGPIHVYFGHDAVRKLQKYQFATGLDTACVYGNQLTGRYATGDKRFVSVKAKKAYR